MKPKLYYLTIVILVAFILLFPYLWPLLIIPIITHYIPNFINNFLFFSSKIEKEPSRTNHIYISSYTKKAYLSSNKWNTIRKSILKRDAYTCQGCLATDTPLEVHHLSYSNFTKENQEDLVSLCRKCHQRQHDTYGYDYNTTFSPIIKERLAYIKLN